MVIPHLALALLLPAAWLTWRWSRLVSGALWLTLAVWLAYRGIKWQRPDVWAVGHLEWMRGISMLTGLVGAAVVAHRQYRRALLFDRSFAMMRDSAFRQAVAANPWRTGEALEAIRERAKHGRPDLLAALLVASMGVDLTAWLIHRGAGQWGPQPFFQASVLLAMCAISVWPRRKS